MHSTYHEFHYPDCSEVNPAVVSGYGEAMKSGHVRKSHLFAGRYENIYIDREAIPALQSLIPFWINAAASVLDKKAEDLRCGFWFNEMGPGDVTQPHNHDDDDEWLSGVYYLIVPSEAGDLILHDGDDRLIVHPEVGKLVLFSSSEVHEVTENLSQQMRLSIGINFGYSGGV